MTILEKYADMKATYMAASTEEDVRKVAIDNLVQDICIVLNIRWEAATNLWHEMHNVRSIHHNATEMLLTAESEHIRTIRNKLIAATRANKIFMAAEISLIVAASIGLITYLIWNFT